MAFLIRLLTRTTAGLTRMQGSSQIPEAATSLNSILLHENKGLREALKLEKRKRQRGKGIKNLLFEASRQP
jgi:hypothetical protein